MEKRTNWRRWKVTSSAEVMRERERETHIMMRSIQRRAVTHQWCSAGASRPSLTAAMPTKCFMVTQQSPTAWLSADYQQQQLLQQRPLEGGRREGGHCPGSVWKLIEAMTRMLRSTISSARICCCCCCNRRVFSLLELKELDSFHDSTIFIISMWTAPRTFTCLSVC